MADSKSDTQLHVAMYPWLAMGHLTTFLHISNKLAERGHRISFFIPTKAQDRLKSFNLYPNLITFIPITVPHVPGLPQGAETGAEVPFPLQTHLMTAMDLTKPTIQSFLQTVQPNFIFFDLTHWLPKLVRDLNLNIKSVLYCTVSPATIGFSFLSSETNFIEKSLTEHDLMGPPLNFPHSSIKLATHEARESAFMYAQEFGSGVTLGNRSLTSFREADAIAFKSCREMDGPYLDYVRDLLNKPIFCAGPVIPEPPTVALDPKCVKWLEQFEPKSVIFCAFGSQCILKKDQFQELVLAFEKTGFPFFCALKPPMGCESIESALPEGFEERVKERGVVDGGWVQQQLILKHPSIGCFVTHCGLGSLSEALVNECQLVLLPNAGDQIINARVMSGDLKVGVEVKTGDEDGLFDRDSVFKAVMDVMDKDSEIGREVRDNHGKWRNILLKEGLEKSYIDGFIESLKGLLA